MERWFVVLTVALLVGAGAEDAAARGVPPVGHGGTRVLGLATRIWPPLWLRRFAYLPAPPAGTTPILREEGRRVLSFPIGEDASELFIRVAGRVEFERAIIEYSDGTRANVDAFGANCSGGMYRLAAPDERRPVQWVNLVLRARSRSARVGVFIGR